MAQAKISVISCGGTIEKTYDEGDGSLKNRESILEDMLFKKMRHPHHDLSVKAIMHVDSLDMKDEHRVQLLNAIRHELKGEQPVLVIHGTDTMDKSAQFVQESLEDLKYPVVFTGAMKPLGFIDSDALQNVSQALMVCELSSPGVYICMHGKVIPANLAKKNYETKTFENINEK